jgi:hypothetical protein
MSGFDDEMLNFVGSSKEEEKKQTKLGDTRGLSEFIYLQKRH